MFQPKGIGKVAGCRYGRHRTHYTSFLSSLPNTSHNSHKVKSMSASVYRPFEKGMNFRKESFICYGLVQICRISVFCLKNCF